MERSLALFGVFDNGQHAVQGNLRDRVLLVDPNSVFIPVLAGVCALREESLGWRAEEGVVLRQGVGVGPGLVRTMGLDGDLAGQQLERHAADHPAVDGLVELAAQDDLGRSEGLWTAHPRWVEAVVVGGDLDRLTHVVQLGESEAVLLEDEWFGCCDGVLIAVLALVDLGCRRVEAELLCVLLHDVLVSEPKQDVVELQIGVDESALDVQEVESLEGVLQGLFGEGEGEVPENTPCLLDMAG